MADIAAEWPYRRKYNSKTLDEYDLEDKIWQYNHTEFYEIEDNGDDLVTIHFFSGNTQTGTNTIARRHLNYCERLWGNSMYYRTPEERIADFR